MEATRESERKSYGAVMNSFDELEPAYVAHFRNITTVKAWSVGPVSLWSNRDIMKYFPRVLTLSKE